MKSVKISNPKLNIATPKMGMGKEAPGLNQRDKADLYKAIGLDRSQKINPVTLKKLADTHPDPAVRKQAGSMLSKLAFKLKPV